ncbi:MAG TPA: hypothetical protein VHM90_11950 [Phycisphaerae bacterium]|nr:hypothetical protein [Phycisphaerae bacterium]
MKRLTLIPILAVAALTAAAAAQHIPSVHGSLDAVTVLPTTAPASQAAHSATMPSGHPQVPAEGAGGDVQAMHQGMATSKTGALRVNVSQGTKLAAPVGKDPVRVDLLSQGVSIKTILTTVGDKGIIELHDLPLEIPFQPVITVTHGGAEQQKVGAVMHKFQPAIEFDMQVFEVTTEKPEWTIGLRNIEAQAVATEGANPQTFIRLVDMIGGFDPADRAWAGEGEDRHTLSIDLPEGATNVQYGPGMAEADPRVAAGKVLRGKTMLPGSTQYIFACDLPVKDGRAAATFTAPADTTLFALYLPGEWKVEKTSGLELGNASGAHAAGKAQLLKAKAIKAGAVLSVELSGIKAPAPVAANPAADHTTDLQLPKTQK